MKSHVLHTVVFLVWLQGKFDIDHSWEFEGNRIVSCLCSDFSAFPPSDHGFFSSLINKIKIKYY